MNGELVSIVMATYNGKKYLRQQLDSILQQTYQHIELIVVDDASTDETLSILGEYAALDGRIHIFPSEMNLGLVANFERGLTLTHGDFIVLSDQDDVFRRDKIELLLAVLKDQPNRDLAVSDLTLIDEAGIEIAPSMWHYQKLNPRQNKPFRRLLYSNFVTGCAIMFRRRLLEIALPFPTDCIVHDWWLAVVSTSSRGGGICLVNEQLTAYRQHHANAIGAKAFMSKKNIFARIKSRQRGMTLVSTRNYFRELDVARLNGYLEKDLWSENERLIIINTKKLFEGYLKDAHSGLLNRLIKIPQRVRYAAITGRVEVCISVVAATVWPYK